MQYPPPLIPYHNPNILPAHDPAAVDFRAFYPYTPNEVKHRKRTTSAQLKVLESVFKRDTKPNATLRNELAQELDMTARGVQVWFQNRRAKEKSKSAKAAAAGAGAVAGKSGSAPESPAPAASSSSPSTSSGSSSLLLKQEDNSTPPASVDQKHCKPVSPPQLHLITDVSNSTWQNSPVEPPPDSATFLSHSRPSFVNSNPTDLLNLRRGSLPVNALFPQSNSAVVPEWFDPLHRRRSVDASLQRLAANPYAPLARTKNSALFGPRFGVAPYGRFNNHRVLNSSASARPHHYPSVPHVNIRRSSMDSRRLGLMLRTNTASPAPIPTPYINSRASLPDGHLYAVSQRSIGSPIPGPLPSPNFSFGAASTPSMTSPSSADSERNSPDSLRSFSFPGADDREEDGASPTYDAYSRYGSVVSIATSESSLSSSYFPEMARADQDLSAELHNGARRNSCSPGQFIDFTELDPNATYGMGENNPMGYPQEDYGIIQPQDIVVPTLVKTYLPPASMTPNLDRSATSNGVPSTVSISQTSELAFALHGQSDESPSRTPPQDSNHPYLAYRTDNSGDLAPHIQHPSETTSLMYQGNISNGDAPQGTFNAASFDLYNAESHPNLNHSLYPSYNDQLNQAPIDNGVNHGHGVHVEAFAAYS